MMRLFVGAVIAISLVINVAAEQLSAPVPQPDVVPIQKVYHEDGVLTWLDRANREVKRRVLASDELSTFSLPLKGPTPRYEWFAMDSLGDELYVGDYSVPTYSEMLDLVSGDYAALSDFSNGKDVHKSVVPVKHLFEPLKFFLQLTTERQRRDSQSTSRPVIGEKPTTVPISEWDVAILKKTEFGEVVAVSFRPVDSNIVSIWVMGRDDDLAQMPALEGTRPLYRGSGVVRYATCELRTSASHALVATEGKLWLLHDGYVAYVPPRNDDAGGEPVIPGESYRDLRLKDVEPEELIGAPAKLKWNRVVPYRPLWIVLVNRGDNTLIVPGDGDTVIVISLMKERVQTHSESDFGRRKLLWNKMLSVMKE